MLVSIQLIKVSSSHANCMKLFFTTITTNIAKFNKHTALVLQLNSIKFQGKWLSREQKNRPDSEKKREWFPRMRSPRHTRWFLHVGQFNRANRRETDSCRVKHLRRGASFSYRATRRTTVANKFPIVSSEREGKREKVSAINWRVADWIERPR